MKRKFNRKFCGILALTVTLVAIPVSATDVQSLENKTNDLQEELEGVNQELLEISNQIEDTEAQIENVNNEMLRLEDSLSISKENEERQYEAMKARIKYMYENDGFSMLEFLCSAESMSDFLNKADFVQNISSYDREKFELLKAMREGIDEQEASLEEEQASLEELESQLKAQQESLEKKAEETSTDLKAFNAQLQALREEEQRKAEEEAAAAAAAAAAAEAASQSASASSSFGSSNENSSGSKDTGSSNSSSGNSGYVYASGGALTPEKGVVYYDGHRETYYSQRVLPGGGLNIPGRHVAEDGTVRDIDGYICVASSDYPRGTIVNTSLGLGKVYDSGCASGTIDIYTDW